MSRFVESFIVIGAGILFVGFSGSRWTKFFTKRYLSYIASVGVKLFVLYLIMIVGMEIARPGPFACRLTRSISRQ